MVDPLSPSQLAADAIYLGILTARGLKPLSRLEYTVAPPILDFFRDLGLLIVPISGIARNGRVVTHLILGRDRNLLDRYRSAFDGALLQGETAAVVQAEAQFFGYPACCAAAYSQAPHTPNHLDPAEQALLFHIACPECTETPALIPGYRSAFIQAWHIYLQLCRSDSSAALAVIYGLS